MDTLLDNLDFFTEDIIEFKDDVQRKLSEVGYSREKERNKISHTIELMRQAVKKAESKLLAENVSLFSTYENNLQRSLQAASQLEREINSVRSQAEDYITSGTTVGSSENSMICKYDSMQDRFASLREGMVQPLFQLCDEDLTILQNMDFGKFEGTDLPVVPPVVGFPTQLVGADMNPCFLTGFLWFNHMFVLSDKANKKLKFFEESGKFLGELLFSNALPYGICHVRGDSVAVTLPRIRQIYIVRLNNIKTEVITNFHTYEGYAGLDKGLDGNSLVASVASNTPGESQVDIIGFKGEVFVSFKNNPELQIPLFKFPRYVAAFQGALIISDWRKDCVIFFHVATGSVLKEYRGTREHPLINPYDIALDERGNVYILNGKDGTVHVVDTQCNLTDVIRETSELLSPRLLAYNDESGLLAVTHGAGDIKTYHHRVPVPKIVQPANSFPSSPSLLMPPNSDISARCPSPGF